MMLAAYVLIIWFGMMLGFRYVAAKYLIHTWREVCAYYVAGRIVLDKLDSKDSVDKMIECSAVWPMSQIIGHFWIWDFRHFIINKTEMNLILDYFAPSGKVKGDEGNK